MFVVALSEVRSDISTCVCAFVNACIHVIRVSVMPISVVGVGISVTVSMHR